MATIAISGGGGTTFTVDHLAEITRIHITQTGPIRVARVRGAE